MASRVIHDKIPHNVRVNKGATVNKTKHDSTDQVVPSMRLVKPSVIGIAQKKRLAAIAGKATTLATGLDAILTIRDGEEAAGDPELHALASDPRMAKAFNLAFKKLTAQVDSILRTDIASKEPNPEAVETDNSGHFANAPSEGDPTVAGGLIGDAALLTKNFFAVDHETRLQIEAARKRLARLQMDRGMGNPGDIVRAQFDLDPRAVGDAELYSMFEDKRSAT